MAKAGTAKSGCGALLKIDQPMAPRMDMPAGMATKTNGKTFGDIVNRHANRDQYAGFPATRRCNPNS